MVRFLSWRTARGRSSISQRLALLIGAAFLPVIGMASLVAWQNYQDTARLATEAAALAHQAVTNRAELALSIMERTLEHVGRNPPPLDQSGSCDLALANMLISHEKLLNDLTVVDPTGRVLCRGSDDDILPPSQLQAEAAIWWQRIQQNPVYILDSMPESQHATPTIIGVAPMMHNGRPFAMLIGSLNIETLSDIGKTAGAVSIWLVPAGAAPMALNAPWHGAEPEQKTFSALAREDGTTSIRHSSSGDFYAYASGPLADGHRLIIGRQSNDIHLKAKGVLIRHSVDIAAFALIGLLAMALGSMVGIVRPVRRLHREVERWQKDGKFDTGSFEHAPREIRDLAESFRAATASLTERAMQLRMASVQQELLMQEIHHRVKNNLQIVASLLNLQASRIRQPEAQAEFQSARDRVRALATLHRHLYSHGELNTINMRSFLTELCEQLFAAMGQQPGQKIKLDIDAPELQMSSDQAVPLALIITETVSNALKYAFPANHSGRIAVKLVNEQDSVVLTVQDNGVGIGTQDKEDSERRSGIGIQLIQGFVRQLGATLTMQEGDGTRYEISMKLQRGRDVSMFVHNALARSGVEQT